MLCGKTVEAFGLPGRLPPMAMFRSTYIGSWGKSAMVENRCTPSTNQSTRVGFHSTANRWKPVVKFGPAQVMPLDCTFCTVPKWCVIYTVVGRCPTVSMMSISGGQSWVEGSSQNAGQYPCPAGTHMRASKRPYCWSSLPAVLMRAET